MHPLNFVAGTLRLEVSAVAVFALGACLALPISAWAKDKDKDKQPAAADVDSGSFGVYSGGHRVMTETFSIKPRPDGQRGVSEFKSEQGEQKAAQSSELDLTPSVELQALLVEGIAPRAERSCG